MPSLTRASALSSLCILLLTTVGCVQRVPDYRIDSKYTVADPQFGRTLGSLLGPSLIPGNAILTLKNGDEIFPAMLDAIRAARHSITLETYIYWSGDIGEQFTEALCERARAGVRVHVLVDTLGSAKMDKRYFQRMKDAGIEVKKYHPFYFYDLSTFADLDHRTHRKILVVDGKVGFTGGVGIADAWKGNADGPEHWRDNHYRILGPAVAQLQAVFMDNWMTTTGEVLHGEEYFPLLENAGETWAQVFKSSAKGGSESMHLMFLLSLAAAGEDVRMESAYFVPDALTQRMIIAARRRGVRVEIIVPGPQIDEKIVRHASRATWGTMLKEGVKIYEYQPTMFHCKLMIVDRKWVSLGSSNLDNRSFRLNDEANLNVLDEAFAEAQIRLFNEDKQHAREVTYERWAHRPLLEKIKEHTAWLFAWEL